MFTTHKQMHSDKIYHGLFENDNKYLKIDSILSLTLVRVQRRCSNLNYELLQ